MLRAILALVLSATLLSPQSKAVFAMKTGVLLRMHVIAQDDSAEMQRMKLCVRDAVQAAYVPEGHGTMLAEATQLLPQLTLAAQEAAAREGFTGAVSVSIEHCTFDQRTLDGLTFPAGTYPALMIRLGDAQGHNWWGLVDPSLAIDCAALDGLGWDWSFSGLWRALFPWAWEVEPHE